MWCGCRPTDKFSTAAPQPFSTMDEEAGGGAITVSSESPAQDGVLSCMAQWSHDGLLTQAEPARV